MTDPLLSWRAEFPIVDTCTYLVSHSLGAMPRRTSAYLAKFADEWGGRGVRAWHEGWWEIGVETGNLLAPILGVARGSITMHQNATVAQSIVASLLRLARPPQPDRAARISIFRRTTICSKASAATARTIVYRAVGRHRARADRSLRRRDRRSHRARPDLARAVPERLPAGRAAGRRESASRRRARRARRLSGGRHRAARSRRARRRLRGRRLGQVAVRRPGRRVSLRAPGSRQAICSPAVVGWAGHASPFAFETGPIRYAEGHGALPERHAQRAVALFRPRRLRDRRRDWRAGDSREVAARSRGG